MKMAMTIQQRTKPRETDKNDAACCAPGLAPAELAETLRPEDEELAALAKALGHPVRILILRNLLRIGTCYFGRLAVLRPAQLGARSEEHTSELQSLMRLSYAVFCLKLNSKQHTLDSLLSSLVRPHTANSQSANPTTTANPFCTA